MEEKRMPVADWVNVMSRGESGTGDDRIKNNVRNCSVSWLLLNWMYNKFDEPWCGAS